MKKQDIKRYLQDYSIYGKRKTTINHAFSSAISVSDTYDEEKIDNALKILGQDPEGDLSCIYCDLSAETWDHVMPTVKHGKYSGYGHQIGNLVPCCKDCNSKKGNKDWKVFLKMKRPSEIDNPDIANRIEAYLDLNKTDFESLLDDDINNEIEALDEIKGKVMTLLQDGDNQAKIIRQKLRDKSQLAKGISIFES